MHPFLACAELFMDLQRAVRLQYLIRSVVKYKEPKNSPGTKSQVGTLPPLQEHNIWAF